MEVLCVWDAQTPHAVCMPMLLWTNKTCTGQRRMSCLKISITYDATRITEYSYDNTRQRKWQCVRAEQLTQVDGCKLNYRLVVEDVDTLFEHSGWSKANTDTMHTYTHPCVST